MVLGTTRYTAPFKQLNTVLTVLAGVVNIRQQVAERLAAAPEDVHGKL